MSHLHSHFHPCLFSTFFFLSSLSQLSSPLPCLFYMKYIWNSASVRTSAPCHASASFPNNMCVQQYKCFFQHIFISLISSALFLFSSSNLNLMLQFQILTYLEKLGLGLVPVAARISCCYTGYPLLELTPYAWH